MGYYHCTYFFYGVHVPADRFKRHRWEEGERLTEILKANKDRPGWRHLGHMEAGDYDRDELFLSIDPDPENHESTMIPLGSFAVMEPGQDLSKPRLWNTLLSEFAEEAGYGELKRPGWIVVPDMC